MKSKQWIVVSLVLLGLLWIAPAISPAFAAFGAESKVQSFFDEGGRFLTKVVGSGVFILGIIASGIKLAAGDHDGLRNTVMVVVGGAIIFLAKPILDLLTRISGIS